MSDNEILIKQIVEKCGRLIKDYQNLQKENEKLSGLVTQLKKSQTDNKTEIDLLEQKLQILKASSDQMNEKDHKDFEKRISNYIKNIDQCIEILSE